MNPGCPYLSLGRPSRPGDPPLVVVGATDAIGLRRDGAYELVEQSLVESELRDLGLKLSFEARSFFFRLGLASPYSTTSDDRHLIGRVRNAIRSGELVGLRESTGWSKAQADPTLEQRRLVKRLESETHARLNYAGRQYRLVAGDDLARAPDRESYEVVARADATRILDGLASECGRADLAALFGAAKSHLTLDWRPPLGPKGLVLLRKIRNQQSSAKHESVVTPSQIAKMMAAEQSVTLELVVLGLDDKPLDGVSYVIEAPDEEPHEGDLGSSGKVKITSTRKGNASVALKVADAGAH